MQGRVEELLMQQKEQWEKFCKMAVNM